MSSEAQVAANRQNAAKSTGPRTTAGKLACSGNALRHGVLSTVPVLPCEKAEEWEAHRNATVESLSPATYMEGVLADRIASTLWRLRRVNGYEVSATHFRTQNPLDMELAASGYGDGPLILASDPVLERVQRYETHLERSLYRALHELERLQATRTGSGSAPLALDLDVSLGTPLPPAAQDAIDVEASEVP